MTKQGIRPAKAAARGQVGDDDGNLVSPEAEWSVIGALLFDNTSASEVGSLQPSDFHDRRLGGAFATIMQMVRDCKAADVVTVGGCGHDYELLQEAYAYVVTARNIGRHAAIVRDRATDRRLAALGLDLIEAARAGGSRPVEEKIVAADEALVALRGGAAGGGGPQWVGSLMPSYIDILSARGEGRDTIYPTGLHDVDDQLAGGLRPGRVYVVGARPSMGKTTLGMTIARHVAADHPVVFFSMEAPRDQLNDGTVAALGHVALDKVLRPDPNDGDTWSRISEGLDRAARLQLILEDRSGLTLTDVRAGMVTAQRMSGERKLALVVIDYLQLMRGSGDTRATEIAGLANGLKALALQHAVAMLVLAQCNREPDKKADGADSMADLNESGGIEQAADVVALLHREAVRTPGVELENYAELRFVKNRIGKTGRRRLFFNGAYQFFGNWTGPAPASATRSAARERYAAGFPA